MNSLDLFIARTQRALSVMYGVLFAGTFALLLFLPKPIDETIKALLLMMIGGLIALISTQNSFWYMRTRPAGVPDPTTTTTRTEVTTTPSVPPEAPP